eukprot:COSAG06_NODE_4622_length_4092_cov_2.411971_7_plen_43_part_00
MGRARCRLRYGWCQQGAARSKESDVLAPGLELPLPAAAAPWW